MSHGKYRLKTPSAAAHLLEASKRATQKPAESVGNYFGSLELSDRIGIIYLCGTLATTAVLGGAVAMTKTAEDAFIQKYVDGKCLQNTMFDPDFKNERGEWIGGVALPGQIDDIKTMNVVAQMGNEILSFRVLGESLLDPIGAMPELVPSAETSEILGQYGC